jgi:hypothetical protein
VTERLSIAVAQEQLDDLRSRLRATRRPDTVPGSGWDYGTDLAYLRDCAPLVQRLRLAPGRGDERYGAQGGDWGAIATAHLGVLDADHLIGLHLNMANAPRPPDVDDESPDRGGAARPRGDARVPPAGDRLPGDPGDEAPDPRTWSDGMSRSKIPPSWPSIRLDQGSVPHYIRGSEGPPHQ